MVGYDVYSNRPNDLDILNFGEIGSFNRFKSQLW